MCSEPTSLAVLMTKADKYATGDSVMRVKVTASDKDVPTLATPKPAVDNRGGQNNNKRKADQLDSHSNNKLVANVEGEALSTQTGSQRKRPNKGNWLPRQTFEHMLDAPCKIHSGAQPSTHTLQQCSFARGCRKGRACRLPQVHRLRLKLRLPVLLRLHHHRLTTTAVSTTTTDTSQTYL
ncbi:hypothetical protein ZWY2020_028649 [Hordeum vulgare]|nr:hypothetical protein ZWY2020_028649 [Hordeum vulgare]